MVFLVTHTKEQWNGFKARVQKIKSAMVTVVMLEGPKKDQMKDWCFNNLASVVTDAPEPVAKKPKRNGRINGKAVDAKTGREQISARPITRGWAELCSLGGGGG